MQLKEKHKKKQTTANTKLEDKSSKRHKKTNRYKIQTHKDAEKYHKRHRNNFTWTHTRMYSVHKC